MSKQRIVLNVDESGTITGIYDDALAPLIAEGSARVARASNVEPVEGGGWSAAMVDGPVLGPFNLRAEALAAEREWIESNVLGL